MKIRKINPRLNLLLCVAVVFGSLGVYVLAQRAEPTPGRGKLADAVGLLSAGQPQAAIEKIGTIKNGEPDYTAAQCYKALALYALGDKKSFWKTVGPDDVQQALVQLKISEEVWPLEMDAFLAYGKFDSLSRKIAKFEAAFPTSPRLPEVQEYRLAGLIDRGVKKSRDASRAKDESQRKVHQDAAQASLKEFLTRAAAFSHKNYKSLPGRALNEDIWVARILTGEGDKALAEIPSGDARSREKFKLLQLELDLDLQRDDVDGSLQRLAEFEKEFPHPVNMARVSKAAAVLNFRKGRQLSLKAQTAEMNGDEETGAAFRAEAAKFFGVQRSLQQNITEDAAAGITGDGVLELREDLLYSYYLQKDYKQVSALTTGLIAESRPGELNWILGKLYQGFALIGESPQKPAPAAAIFDEVLALGFNEEHHHDRLLVGAANWRLKLFLTAGDTARAGELFQRVQNSECRRDYKVAFAKEFAGVISLP